MIVAVTAIATVAASPANAANIYTGCDPKQWGTLLCWNPSNPGDVAAMHSCPMWTDRHTRLFSGVTGAYNGYVKIHSTVSCKLAHKLMTFRSASGAGYYPAGGWYWWPGFGSGGFWRRLPKEVQYGFHIARTNERQGSSAKPTMLEHDLVTYDVEGLVDCSKVPKAVRCVNVTPASYAGVRL
jgi:hypothetical protein